MATSSTYCTHRDVKDVFPNMDDYDTKTPIYGWEEGILNFTNTNIDCYFAHNTGSIDTLFWDGAEIDKIPFNTTETTKVNHGSFSGGHSSVTVDSESAFAADDIIKIDNEYFKIYSVSSNTLTFDSGSPPIFRGLFNTNSQHHADDSSVYKIVDASTDVGGNNSPSSAIALSFVYDPDLDLCILITKDVNPQDYLIEAGEDYSTLVTRIMKNASRFLDARLDANLPRDQFKDKEGNYDYMIVRTAALLSAKFLIKAQEPGNPMADEFSEEIEKNIEELNTGKTRLSGNVTGDASKGIVREVVAPQNSNGLHIVDTRGHYDGVYDLIKIVINTAGVIGTAKFDVYGRSTDSLKSTKVVDAEIINGQYQSISSGLQVRFAGKDSSSAATAGGTPDEWEIEVWGRMESLDDNIGNVRSIKMTRGQVTRRNYKL